MADQTYTANTMRDEDLWRFLGWEPTSPARSSRILHPHSPRDWSEDWRPIDAPHSDWSRWAKQEILSGAASGRDELLYLCRVLRVLEFVHRDGIEQSFLATALISAMVVSGEEKGTFALRGRASVMIARAENQGLIVAKDVDEWQPGMRSGSGWRRYFSLTLAGQHLLRQLGEAPTFWEGYATPDQLGQRAAAGDDGSDAETVWLRVTDGAKLLMKVVSDLGLKKARARVSRAARDGKFRTNGKTGSARRIDQDSFNSWRWQQYERDKAEAYAWADAHVGR